MPMDRSRIVWCTLVAIQFTWIKAHGFISFKVVHKSYWVKGQDKYYKQNINNRLLWAFKLFYIFE